MNDSFFPLILTLMLIPGRAYCKAYCVVFFTLGLVFGLTPGLVYSVSSETWSVLTTVAYRDGITYYLILFGLSVTNLVGTVLLSVLTSTTASECFNASSNLSRRQLILWHSMISRTFSFISMSDANCTDSQQSHPPYAKSGHEP
ncbi:hypothetical protein BDP27DRAFT_613206 [Rhodocollybia butyracea]|uniref:Uncharacterized protein n=1 Tax=Rhodocollybia butyracea TaxID=206335 RepID=A0A9P5U9Z0_9AGAR|nr:hypothetical protein BDP27DRAFT_613206 [Rhodocollybia butyracea]